MKANFHTHTTFCDGKNTPEEMVREAIACGMKTLGFSGHGYTGFDGSFCMDDPAGYRKEILRLKKEYEGRLTILLGVEEDLYEYADRDAYDYIIGSMHYLKVGDVYHSLDCDYATLKHCVDTCFAGDSLALANEYFETFCRYIETRKPDIVGHFDIITKFDEKNPPLFLGKSGYEKLACAYAERAAKCGCLFEVNTGAIARGYRTNPYPTLSIVRTLRENGARFILSSDCHSKDGILYGFDIAKEVLRQAGVSSVCTLTQAHYIQEECL